jgi:hypothetical protein
MFLAWLAAILAGWASPCRATARDQEAESIANARAKVEAAYRKGEYDTFIQILRNLASQQSAFVEQYRRTALQGSATAQGILGVMYENGIGVSEDPAEATRWYRKSAEQGDPRAQEYLGDNYRRGLGVPRDFAEAANWYRKASEQADAHAQGKLSMLYAEGLGVEPDSVLAYMWMTLAVQHFEGAERDVAMKRRDELSARMSTVSIEKAQQLAREWKPAIASAAGGVQTPVSADTKAAGAVNNSPQESATATPGPTPIFPSWKWDSGKSLEVHTPPGASSPSIPGYTWLEIKSLGFSLLRPTGWFYKEVEKNGTISAFMTKENIDEKGSFQTGLTIHGIPTKDMDPITAARGYIMVMKSKNSKVEALSDPVEMKVAGKSFVRLMVRDRQHPIQMAIQTIGDPQAKRVVIITFEAPADSWADAWKLGEPIMGLIRFDSP